MIILNKINETEHKEANLILNQENIKDDLSQGVVYTLKDGKIIIGIGKVKSEFKYGILKYLVIKEEYRGSDFGDALLRVLLFKLKSMKIEKIFYPYKNAYLMKKGFQNNDKKHIDSYKIYLDISNFFNIGCLGDQNGL